MDSGRDLLDLLDPRRLYVEVGRKHEDARGSYAAPITVADQREFVAVVGDYVRHHLRAAEGCEVPVESAFNVGIETLREEYLIGRRPDGFVLALQAGIGNASGNVPDVLNAIARGLRRKGVRDYLLSILYEGIDPLSTGARLQFAERFAARYGEALDRFGTKWRSWSGEVQAERLVELLSAAVEELLTRRTRFGSG